MRKRPLHRGIGSGLLLDNDLDCEIDRLASRDVLPASRRTEMVSMRQAQDAWEQEIGRHRDGAIPFVRLMIKTDSRALRHRIPLAWRLPPTTWTYEQKDRAI